MNFSYLVHGNQRKTTALFFRIGRSTIGNLIAEVCPIIYNVLKEQYLKFPSKEDFEGISEDFQLLWDFPNCIGSIDGMHVRIKAPPHSGGEFNNYKKFFSVVLMAVCDARQKFLWASVGNYGKIGFIKFVEHYIHYITDNKFSF